MTGLSTSAGRQDAHEQSSLDWPKIQTTNVTVQVHRKSDRKRAIFPIGRVYSPLSDKSSY
jgi:hypothetical protein